MTAPADETSAKAALRAAALARRDAIGEAERARLSAIIARRAIALLEAAAPRTLAVYRAIRSEVDPEAIATWARARGIVVALPAIGADGILVYRRADAETPLVDAGFGTRAPGASAPEAAPDALIVPLAGFDRTGHRLGYGFAHYDRGLARLAARGLTPLAVGVAFSVQEVDAIGAESHDVRLDAVVTENATIDLRAPDPRS